MTQPSYILSLALTTLVVVVLRVPRKLKLRLSETAQRGTCGSDKTLLQRNKVWLDLNWSASAHIAISHSHKRYRSSRPDHRMYLGFNCRLIIQDYGERTQQGGKKIRKRKQERDMLTHKRHIAARFMAHSRVVVASDSTTTSIHPLFFIIAYLIGWRQGKPWTI